MEIHQYMVLILLIDYFEYYFVMSSINESLNFKYIFIPYEEYLKLMVNIVID